MSTKAKIGFGIVLSYSATSGGSYTPVGEILEITPAGSETEKIKVQRSDSATAVVEKIPGWKDLSDAELTVTYDPTQRAALEALEGVPYFFKIVYPKVGAQATNGDTDAFAGFICKIGKETPIKDMMKTKISIAVNGDVVLTSGS